MSVRNMMDMTRGVGNYKYVMDVLFIEKYGWPFLTESERKRARTSINNLNSHVNGSVYHQTTEYNIKMMRKMVSDAKVRMGNSTPVDKKEFRGEIPAGSQVRFTRMADGRLKFYSVAFDKANKEPTVKQSKKTETKSTGKRNRYDLKYSTGIVLMLEAYKEDHKDPTRAVSDRLGIPYSSVGKYRSGITKFQLEGKLRIPAGYPPKNKIYVNASNGKVYERYLHTDGYYYCKETYARS